MSTPTPVPSTNPLTAIKAEENKIWTWIKANWHHVLGYASIVAAIKKLI